jgi:thiamine kinase-like enzyme
MFLKHNGFKRENQTDSMLVKELAQKLAKFHSLNVPIKRNANDWYVSIIDFCYNTVFERFPNIQQLIKDNNLKVLNCETLLTEINWIKTTIKSSNTPIVFSHNDFRGNNIMVKTENSIPNNKLLLCDLENARYGYRGVDFACIFSQWDRDLGDFGLYCKSAENNSHHIEITDYPPFPQDITFTPFIADYLEECSRIYGNVYMNDKRNCMNSILSETKLFSLLIKLFSVLAFMQQNEAPHGIVFDKVLTLVCILDFNYY